MSWLLDPYRGSEFLRLALAGAVIVGIVAPVVGVWIVLRRIAYLGDAMSHGMLGGVAAAELVGVSLVAGGLAAGLLMGLAVAAAGARGRLGRDSIIGIVETVLFASGVIIISTGQGSGLDLSHYLFGQISTIGPDELAVHGALGAVALGTIAVRSSDLRAATFDPLHAAQVGISTRSMDHLLLALVSITVVVSLQSVGLLMSVAMLVTPAATARLVTERIGPMSAVAALLGVTAAVGGLTASYHLSSPPGATIALATAVQFVIVLLAVQVRERAVPRRQPTG